MEKKTKQKYTINSLARGLQILDVLAQTDHHWGVTELSRHISADKSLVYRTLSTLSSLGYVEQDPATRKYTLGLKIIELTGRKLRRLELFTVAKPILRELTRITGETAHIAIMVKDHMIYLDKEEVDRPFNLSTGMGLPVPLHSSAVGKALLACLSEAEVDQLLSAHLERFTEKTIVGLSRLREELRRVTAEGYAVDDEETYPGVRCLASPIWNHYGRPVAALGVSGSTHRITPDLVPILAKDVTKAAAAVSARLGYSEHVGEKKPLLPQENKRQEERTSG